MSPDSLLDHPVARHRLSGVSHYDAPLIRYRPVSTEPPLWSTSARWEDLAETERIRDLVSPTDGWGHRWTVTYRHGRNRLVASVASVATNDLLVADPIRLNSWHTNKTARAGLRFLHATGRHHAHESLFERKLLGALDFHGATEVASQPFTLTWHDGDRHRHHTPDFLALVEGQVVVINTRPAPLVTDALRQDVAALAEVCLSRGWHCSLVVGYRLPAFTTVETVEAHATAEDHLGYTDLILCRLREHGPARFAEVCAPFDAPVIARALLQRLIWERRVVIDLNQPLEDHTPVALPGQEVHS